MDFREIVFAALLAINAAAITVGVAIIHPPSGWIVGGLLATLWTWLVFSDDGSRR